MSKGSMMPRLDLRKSRAMSLCASIMQEISPYINPDDYNHAYDKLLGLLYDEGIEIITDYTRASAGLPKRLQDGWTLEEVQALEKKRLEIMLNPMAPIFIKEQQ